MREMRATACGDLSDAPRGGGACGGAGCSLLSLPPSTPRPSKRPREELARCARSLSRTTGSGGSTRLPGRNEQRKHDGLGNEGEAGHLKEIAPVGQEPKLVGKAVKDTPAHVYADASLLVAAG
jgi:hypothetical protein